MTAGTAVVAGRRAAQRTLLDTCVVTRPAVGSFDPGTGDYTVTAAQVYTGPCRIKAAGPRETTAAGGEQQLRRPVLVLPHGSAALALGDVVTVTGSAAGSYTVVDRETSSTATADRYEVEESS